MPEMGSRKEEREWVTERPCLAVGPMTQELWFDGGAFACAARKKLTGSMGFRVS